MSNSSGKRTKDSLQSQQLPRRFKAGRTQIEATTNMPKEVVLRKVRKGTKSCVECRQRKIKCIWASDGAETCNNCEARGRPCISQVFSSASIDAIRLTSRERISKLEGVIRNLQASIQKLEARFSLEPIDEAYSDVQTGTAQDDDSESEASDVPPVHPPTHLQQLFDNSLLGTPKPEFMSSPPPNRGSSSPGSFKVARRVLQDLLPPKSEVATMEKFVSVWLASLQTLFPTSFTYAAGDDMTMRWEAMHSEDVHPTQLATYLCPLAIIILHIPEPIAREELQVTKDAHLFIRKVSDAVEQYVFSDDQLVSTLEGLEVSMLFIRLQMLRGRIRKVWVGLRRVVAMAEMLCLPRVASLPPESDGFGDKRQAALDLWTSIISIDRLVSLMFNLPLGSSTYKCEVPSTVMKNGALHLPSVLLRLSASAAAVLEIDELVAAQRPLHEISERVMMADQEWRAMYDLTPAQWWHTPPPRADGTVLYWYQYVGVRMHLQLALRNDESNTFAYSHMRCLEACRNMAVHYPELRSSLPVEFFAGRLYDIQALTPAIFLLHTCYKPGHVARNTLDSPAMLVQGILDMTDRIADRAGGAFAKQVGVAIRSAIEVLQNPNRGKARILTLQIPTLGTIHVGSRASAATALRPTHMPQQQNGSQYDNTLTADDFEMADSLDWFMEISDDHSFPQDGFANQDVISFDTFEMIE